MRSVWAEVDLGAIAHNVSELKGLTAARLMAVVKADAYGHGAVQVGRAALKAGADCLGVALLQEAQELRAAGIKAPVLVLGYTPPEEVEEAVGQGVALTVFNLEQAGVASLAARRLDRPAVLHVKVDTGMGRLGFKPSPKALEEVSRIAALPGVILEGLFTHFATADEEDKGFAREQLERFLKFHEELSSRGLRIPLRHAANSAALLDLPEAHLEMVRPGITLYGYFPSREVRREGIDLRPAMSLKARIILLKEVGPGESVSYGRTFWARERRLIATLPLGYGDGYPRLLSNRGEALVRGRRAPVAGRVCMDYMMLDVTGVPGVREGDEATLFGRQDEAVLPVEELAERLGTISYELLCLVQERVPRVYV